MTEKNKTPSATLRIIGPSMWAYDVLLKTDRSAHYLGRHRENDVILADDQVSGRHCVIFFQEDTWKLRDLDSSNGTFVNGARIQEFDLRDGDSVAIGETAVTFMLTKSTKLAQDDWEETANRLERHSKSLQQAIESAGEGEAVDLEQVGLRSESSNQIDPSKVDDSKAIVEKPKDADVESDPTPSWHYTASAITGPAEGLNRSDLLWIAESIADVMRQLSLKREATRRGLLTDSLQCVIDKTDAENAFLMLSKRESKRWVIEAWIGDTRGWNEYEQKHPVPLSIANACYKSKQIITNAYGTNAPKPTESQIRLDVNSYAAVPLLRKEKRVGVLYVDTRKKMKVFQKRDVELMTRMGDFILDLDSAVRKARESKKATA